MSFVLQPWLPASTTSWTRTLSRTWCRKDETGEDDVEKVRWDINDREHGSQTKTVGILQKAVGILTFVPLLLLPRQGKPVRRKAFHELHPLAYLDALRGYLAITIFTAHTMPRHWKWIPETMLKIPWLQFPFRGGFAALDIFFWISGYAVTYRLVGLMQARKSDKLLDALSSSVFRRYFRLFLPVLPVTLLTVIAIQIGLAIPPEDKAKKIVGNPLMWWIKDSGHQLNPFTAVKGYWDGQTGSELLDPFWSLGAEFRSSMMMFTFCTGACKLSSRTRKFLLLASVPAFIAWQAQWAAMSFLGMWFAECRQEKRAAQTSGRPALQKKTLLDSRVMSNANRSADMSRFRKLALLALFLYSFVVLKDPYDTDKKTLFPHNYLNKLVPDYWHPQMRMHMHLLIGSMMMLYPLDQLTFLQRPLLSTFSQFLGEFSFGIYAAHWPLRWVVWEPRYVKWAMERYGGSAFDSFWIAFGGWFGMAIVLLWAAEIFRRLDWQVVVLLKKLEDRFFDWK